MGFKVSAENFRVHYINEITAAMSKKRKKPAEYTFKGRTNIKGGAMNTCVCRSSSISLAKYNCIPYISYFTLMITLFPSLQRIQLFAAVISARPRLKCTITVACIWQK